MGSLFTPPPPPREARGRGRWCRNSGLGSDGRAGFSVPAEPAVLAANMGQIEWAMWANEQALASGLSECAEDRRGGGGRAGLGGLEMGTWGISDPRL